MLLHTELNFVINVGNQQQRAVRGFAFSSERIADSLLCYPSLVTRPAARGVARNLFRRETKEWVPSRSPAGSILTQNPRWGLGQRQSPQNTKNMLKIWSNVTNSVLFRQNKKAQLTLTNPRDSKGCKNCSNSMCFVSFHRIPFPQIANA